MVVVVGDGGDGVGRGGDGSRGGGSGHSCCLLF